jgi:HD-like signal output (HDOD) protein/CheY-like chemotaxis protein
MKRILFVDDEPHVLRGLRRLLASQRGAWDMRFVDSGAAALESMSERPADVVVSDMRMPGMSGVELLDEVQRSFPQAVRIILSGHADTKLTLRAAGHTHQFMAKPCSADLLKSTVARCLALRDLLHNERLLRLTSKMKTLPSLPRLYQEIQEEIRSGHGSMESVGAIIAKDVGMSAKVLQLVNSAFFGLAQEITTPERAAVFLGMNTIRSLVLSVEIFSEFDAKGSNGLDPSRLWQHSFQTAGFSRAIARAEGLKQDQQDHAFLAGMLHDAGRLVLATNLPEYREALWHSQNEKIRLFEAERQILGTTHAEAGAYLLGIWGLPTPVIEAIAFHHRPSEATHKEFDILTILHAADALEHDEDDQEVEFIRSFLDLDSPADVGDERLEAWRDACRVGLLEPVAAGTDHPLLEPEP